MARIPPIERTTADPLAQQIWDQQVQDHGRMTNMKKTLAHSGVSLRALMEWYPLFDELCTFIPKRTATMFAHAISHETDCLICSSFFRRILIDSGEDPDKLVLDEQTELLVSFGRQIAQERNQVDQATFTALQAQFNERQVVALTAFASIMVATNIINNVLHVDLDDYLKPYKGNETEHE